MIEICRHPWNWKGGLDRQGECAGKNTTMGRQSEGMTASVGDRERIGRGKVWG